MSRSARLRTPHPRGPLVVVAVAALVATLAAAPANAAGYVAPGAPATLVSANPVDHIPHAQNGDVRAYAQIGTTVYVGGSFTSVRNATDGWGPRGYLFAYDQSTGVIRTAFAPRLDGTVHALAVSPDGKLIVGGAFRTVNGVSRLNLVEVDPVTGATVAGWQGRGDGGIVRRLITHDNRLYVGGAFHWINGTRHSLLARLDATTGAIDPGFQIDASVPRASSELVWGLALSPDGGTLVATGNFTQVNGLARNQVVMVDVSGAPTVAPWNTDRFEAPCNLAKFPFYARDVDFSDDGGYFVIAADGGLGAGYCDAISRWETAARGTNVAATWVNFTGNDSVTALEVADGAVYVGGHFRWLNNTNGDDAPGPGAVDRYGLAALNPSNGMPLAWNPTRSGGGNLPAGAVSAGPIVWELWRGDAGLYVGQDSDGLAREYHGRMALLPLAGGRVVPATNAPQGTPGYLYLGAGDGRLTRVPFDGGVPGAPSDTSQPHLTSVRAAFVVSNRLYWARADPTAPSGGLLQASIFSAGTAGAPWVGSGFNSWFAAATMTGAFFLNGRMYHTVAGDDTLYYRYLEPDGSVVGCTAFPVPTRGLPWGQARGLTWVAGRLLYGSVDGALRSVPFDQSAAGGLAVDGASAVVVAAPRAAATWSSPTLFYATS